MINNNRKCIKSVGNMAHFGYFGVRRVMQFSNVCNLGRL